MSRHPAEASGIETPRSVGGETGQHGRRAVPGNACPTDRFRSTITNTSHTRTRHTRHNTKGGGRPRHKATAAEPPHESAHPARPAGAPVTHRVAAQARDVAIPYDPHPPGSRRRGTPPGQAGTRHPGAPMAEDQTPLPYQAGCYRCDLGDPCHGHQTASEVYGITEVSDAAPPAKAADLPVGSIVAGPHQALIKCQDPGLPHPWWEITGTDRITPTDATVQTDLDAGDLTVLRVGPGGEQ